MFASYEQLSGIPLNYHRRKSLQSTPAICIALVSGLLPSAYLLLGSFAPEIPLLLYKPFPASFAPLNRLSILLSGDSEWEKALQSRTSYGISRRL